MTTLRSGLCFALVVLCAAAYTTVPAQLARSDSSQTTPSAGKAPNLKLHGVSLGTKIKWGAQLLFYPEAIKPVRVLHAYKWDTICKGDQTESNRKLGFVFVSSAKSGGTLETGTLIGALKGKALTLKNVCGSSKSLSEPGKTNYLLTLYRLQNQKGGKLYWTDISSAPTTYAEMLTKKSQQTTQEGKGTTPDTSEDIQPSKRH